MNINQLRKIIGSRILYYRRKNKYSQYSLAKSLNLSSNHISQVERGNSTPSLSLILSLANLFNIPIYKLFEPT